MDYARSRATALRLISGFGNSLSATFTRTTRTNFNPLTGEETIPPPAIFSALVVVPPETDRSREQARTMGYDVEFMLSAGFAPEPGDLVTLPGRSGPFTVIAPVETMAPDGEAIAYVVRARKGQ